MSGPISIAGELRLTDAVDRQLQIVHADTMLRDLRPRLEDGCDGLLLVVKSQSLIGIVQASEIRARLECRNRFERERWENSPVESTLAITFDPRAAQTSDAITSTLPREPISCITHLAGDRLLAVSTEDDVLVSWKQLSAVIESVLVDPVTQLPNRKQFDRALCRKLSLAQESQTSLAVLLIDLDHLKTVNDRLGHALGDATLRAVGQALRGALRADDHVVRYGGDEFAAICGGCSPEQIAVPLTRIASAVADLRLAEPLGGLPITVSIGAAVGNRLSPDVDAEWLLTVADQCLYESKHRGRNRAHYACIEGHKVSAIREVASATKPRVPPLLAASR